MRTVYKSSIVGWGFFATAFIAGMHFFPEISSYRRFNFGETYINNDLGVGSLVFVGSLSVLFLGAFCKTVIETDEGFEVYYMYGFQKKWFGKDFIVFNYNEQYLVPVYPGL